MWKLFWTRIASNNTKALSKILQLPNIAIEGSGIQYMVATPKLQHKGLTDLLDEYDDRTYVLENPDYIDKNEFTPGLGCHYKTSYLTNRTEHTLWFFLKTTT